MNNNNKYFCLFASCIPVKGAKRSLICDLDRGTYLFIPNSFYEFILDYEGIRSVGDIMTDFESSDQNIVENYFSFLISNEFGFFTDDPKSFPKLNSEWDYPALINNAIIDVDENSNHEFDKIFKELDSVGCKSLELRFFSNISYEYLNNILVQTDNKRLRNIQIVFRNNLGENIEIIKEKVSSIWAQHKRIDSFVIHSSPINKIIDMNGATFLWMTEEEISSENHCGVINHQYFSVNYNLFFENQNFNSCLNKKISIDKKGNIKNCPSMKQSFGKFGKVKFKEVALDLKFQEKWKIKKDEINVCKDCEFRYICTDCRAYIDTVKYKYAKPEKCNYNPYSATWE